jgi:hypothetical protein
MISNEQLVALYEGGMTIEELQLSSPDLSIVSIKMALMNGSAEYRKKNAGKKEEMFSDDEYNLARSGILHLAIGAESEQVRFRALTRIIDEKKGRKDIRGLSPFGGNIQILNQFIREAEVAEKRAMAKVIDVAPEHTHLKEIAA